MREPLTTVNIHSPFTRSKTRMFSHRNRSGLSRKHISEMESFLGGKCRGASRVFLTKDLRHKRVFTPDVDSVAEEEFEAENGDRKKLLKGFDSSSDMDDVKEESLVMRSEAEGEGINEANGLKDQEITGNGSLPKIKGLNGCRRRKVFKTPSSFSYKRLLPHLMEIVNDASSVSEIEIVDAGSPCTNIKMRSVVENKYAAKTDCIEPQFSDSKPLENPDLGNVHVKLFSIQPDFSTADDDVDGSVEERIQTTPPDTSLFAEVEDGYVGQSMDSSKVLSKYETSLELPVGREQNTKCGPNSMNTTVLNPCSRLKLFKNPKSLSYRRLLPFLMDIAKNSSCSLRKPQPKMPEVVAEEDKQNNEKKCSEDLIQNNPFSVVYQPTSDGSSPDSNSNLVSSISESSSTNYSSNVSPRSANYVTVPDQGMLAEEIPHSLNSPTKTQLDPSSTFQERSSIVNDGILTQQCTSEEPKSVNLDQNSFQIKASDSLVSPNNRPFKGILKRNRRGCKGLCNCLNCASFRLHAERAFEFSRNQLHDAGEVASGLMKELANLRLLLQKSIIENDDSSSIGPHPVLVEQACNKALEAETLAKERLDELNDELRVHCKNPALLQPKVTFSFNI